MGAERPEILISNLDWRKTLFLWRKLPQQRRKILTRSTARNKKNLAKKVKCWTRKVLFFTYAFNLGVWRKLSQKIACFGCVLKLLASLFQENPACKLFREMPFLVGEINLDALNLRGFPDLTLRLTGESLHTSKSQALTSIYLNLQVRFIIAFRECTERLNSLKHQSQDHNKCQIDHSV